MVFRNTLFYSSYYKISCSLYFFSGLLYLALKHLTDRYNLYFNYRSPAYKYVDSTVHSTAVTFTMISTFFVLMSILFYAVIRLGKSLKIDVFLRLFTRHSNVLSLNLLHLSSSIPKLYQSTFRKHISTKLVHFWCFRCCNNIFVFFFSITPFPVNSVRPFSFWPVCRKETTKGKERFTLCLSEKSEAKGGMKSFWCSH